jgi:hypothetical protein
MTTHRQVRIKAPDWEGHRRISVDAAMAPLLREVWRRGIPTFASCQDFEGSGYAYIVFPLPGMARAFCYEAIGMADDLPDGWRTKPMLATLPGLDEPCQAVWFPRELLALHHPSRSVVG